MIYGGLFAYVDYGIAYKIRIGEPTKEYFLQHYREYMSDAEKKTLKRQTEP